MARQVLDNGVILPSEYSDDWYDDMTSNLTKLDEVIGSDAEKLDESDVGAAAISNDYEDLDDKPAYNILRRASVTLTAGGTGNYTDLDSDSKIKAGDYVLDAANKLYSITAIDAANSTYTVSAAAIINITDKSELGAAALSNSYDDLSNLPGYGILRFCSTAITDNSSVPFANISSVSKIAAGDFLLDTAGKMYLIASVDTVNETAAVTTPLTQLAVDSSVMHLSGNETVGGNKTFNDLQIIGYGTQYKGARNAYILPEFAAGYSGLSITTLSFGQTVKIGNYVLDANNKPGLDASKGYIQFATGESNSVNACVLEPRNSTSSSLGTSSNKWSTINGVEPSSLSLPSDTSIDISAYVTDLSGGSNQYVAPENGIVSVDISSTNRYVLYNNNLGIGDRLTGSKFRRAAIIPVRKNDSVVIQSDGGTLNYAKFYPCQGNV